VIAPATFAACLTPDGTGAIATIAVRGPTALEVVEQLFRGTRDLKPGAVHFGKFGVELADEVVLRVKQAVPLPWVELHCHGGRAVVGMILETLRQQGIVTCAWQEFVRQTTERPLQAEAALLLATAPTTRTAAILLDQYQGSCERALAELRTALHRNELESAGRWLAELAGRAVLGRHLTTPWRVVVAGAPNVGKSSLVNALAGYRRSIVSPLPGTTRDLVSVQIALDGWPVELCDTAGLRAEASALEGQGIRLAEDAVAAADLCLWVLDGAATVPTVVPLPDLSFRAGTKTLVLLNKIDQPAGWVRECEPTALRVSAQSGAGLGELCEAIARRLVPEPPPVGAAVPFTPALCDGITAAWDLWSSEKHDEARGLLDRILEWSNAPS
jgi:tRNA modification GTPase